MEMALASGLQSKCIHEIFRLHFIIAARIYLMKENNNVINIIPLIGELIFCEDSSHYFPYRPVDDFREGEIVEVPFPYSDLSGFKTRPALVLASSRMDLSVAFFSTHLSWAAFEDVIFKGNERNGLNSVSLLRISKLFSIHPRLVFRKLGRIEEAEMEVVRWSLKSYFNWKTNPNAAIIPDNALELRYESLT